MLSSLTGEGLEKVARLTFTNGFPDDVPEQLQQFPGGEKMAMSDLIVQACVLLQNTGRTAAVMAAAEARDATRRLVKDEKRPAVGRQ